MFKPKQGARNLKWVFNSFYLPLKEYTVNKTTFKNIFQLLKTYVTRDSVMDSAFFTLIVHDSWKKVSAFMSLSISSICFFNFTFSN